ncbi:hypothetical protein BMF77_pc00076 (plasmid) [Dolichospermum sp. UHCC 0315A]|jgi:hypothetical protein|uniref:hypothetical protein n=1 Tax=Dolichospermum sp. UHCC 0315A TaxID=1914871 RepID=UPI001259B181|nr:hypothetical protein [Dolichospermum sp. UHCC 0315A]QEI44507.1 hypothetical protein BMF77_pc00076 [Dolichospermum sp. UHCC 0315A]
MLQKLPLGKRLAITALLASIAGLNFSIHVIDISNSESRSTNIKMELELRFRGGLPKSK